MPFASVSWYMEPIQRYAMLMKKLPTEFCTGE